MNIPTRTHLEMASFRSGVLTEILYQGTRIRVHPVPYHPLPSHLRRLEGRYGNLTGYYDPVKDMWAAGFENRGRVTIEWLPRTAFDVIS